MTKIVKFPDPISPDKCQPEDHGTITTPDGDVLYVGKAITPQPEYEAMDEFNHRLLEIIIPELERWKSDPLIPTLGIAGDICEGLRNAGLFRRHTH